MVAGLIIALIVILLIGMIVQDAQGFGQTENLEANTLSFIYDGVTFNLRRSIEIVNEVDATPVTKEIISFEVNPNCPHEFVIKPRTLFEDPTPGFKVVYEPGLREDFQVRSSNPVLIKQWFADGRLVSNLNTYPNAFLFKQRKLTVQFIGKQFTATLEKSGKHQDSTNKLSETAKLFYEKIKMTRPEIAE